MMFNIQIENPKLEEETKRKLSEAAKALLSPIIPDKK